MKRRMRWLVSCAAAGLLIGPAGATTIDTTVFTTWDSASYISSGVTSVNFPSSSNTFTGNPAVSSVSPVNFELTGWCAGTCNGEPASVTYAVVGNNGGAFAVDSTQAGAYIELLLPSSGENAFWIGLGNRGGSGPLTLTLSDGETFSPLATSGGFGLALSQPVTWLTLSTSSGEAMINGFNFATSALPQDGGTDSAAEVSTLLLVSGGGLILFGVRRRLRAVEI